MWIVLSPEIAEQISGNYGDYNSLYPSETIDGKLVLHSSVLLYDVFSSIRNVLLSCPVVESVEFPANNIFGE